MMRRGTAWPLVACAAFGLSAHAQDTSSTAPPLPETPVYQDRLIDGLATPLVDEATSPQSEFNREGWPRYFRFEARAGTEPRDGNRTSGGLAFYGLIETPNYGVLSADLSTAPSIGRHALTLRQRSLPVDGGWLVNNEAGVIGTPTPSLTRLPSRVYVPGSLVEGLSTEWNNEGRGLQLQAGTGRPGRLEGLTTSGFRSLAGHVGTIGMQLDSAPFQMAARVNRSDRISLKDNPVALNDFFDAGSAQLSLRHAGDQRNLQVNLVTTQASNLIGQRSGIWLDGDWKSGARQNTWGLYWLERDLTWAGQALPNDTAGIYARTSWYTRQWSAEGGMDWLRSVSNPSLTGVFATGSARYRYSRDVSFGAGASVRHFNGDAWSAYADTRQQNAWGNSTLRLDVASELDQTHSESLTLDHDWLMPTSWSLSTSLTAGRETRQAQSGNRWAAAASLSAPAGASSMVRGTLSSEHSALGTSRTGVNVGLNWRINPWWSLESSYNYNTGKSRSLVSIDPLASPLVSPIASNSSHSLLVVLRFEDRAGSRSVPLGGRALDGGGRIEGTVFLDANGNARQEASESGAPGATVYLDNLYAVRTDSQGRFEFPFVASGKHVITVLNETLPLPWVAPGDGRTSVEVRVREDQRLSIGAVRQSGN